MKNKYYVSNWFRKKIIDDKLFFERRNFIINKALEDAKFNKFSPLHPYETGWDKALKAIITLGLLNVMDALTEDQKQKLENGLYIETYDRAGGKR